MLIAVITHTIACQHVQGVTRRCTWGSGSRSRSRCTGTPGLPPRCLPDSCRMAHAVPGPSEGAGGVAARPGWAGTAGAEGGDDAEKTGIVINHKNVFLKSYFIVKYA